jgi:hypothetical protein
VDPTTYSLHTLGRPELRGPDGALVPLTHQQLALVILLRLLQPERGAKPAKFLTTAVEKLAPNSENARTLAHRHLAGIRKRLGASFKHGTTVRWIQQLSCDADVLRKASREHTPAVREILLRYRPFLEGFPVREEATGFRTFAMQMADACEQAMRTAWATEVRAVTAAAEWDVLFSLGCAGLTVDPTWQEAYQELHRACSHSDPPRLLEAITYGEALLAHLAEQHQRPKSQLRDLVDEAKMLYARQRPSPASYPLESAIRSGGQSSEVLSPAPEKGLPARDPSAGQPEKDLDVFLAIPMDGFGQNYEERRPQALKLLEAVRQIPGCRRVYYAGEDLQTSSDFDDHGLALRDCLAQLRRARFFLMVYPKKSASSVILEAGIALMLGLPGLIFYKEDLPFLLRDVTKVFPSMHTCRVTGFDHVLSLLDDQLAPRMRPSTETN